MKYFKAWPSRKPARPTLPILVLVLLLVGILASLPSRVKGQALQEICEPDLDGAWTALCRDKRILSLWVDPGRVVWIGTDSGLRRYSGRAPEDEILQAGRDPRAPILESLAEDEQIEAVLIDRQGALWIGTRAGLIRIDENGDQVTFTADDGNLPNSWITALAPSISPTDTRGIWIGTLQGYAHFNGEKIDMQSAELQRGVSGKVQAIMPDESGGAYMAMSDKVLFTDTDNVFRVFDETDGLQGGTVNALARSSDGVIWVGTRTGLYRRSGPGFRRVSLGDSAQWREAQVLAVADDGIGGLWLGTRNGLLHFNGELVDDEKTTSDGLPHNRVSLIQHMEDGTLWIGTSSGLARWNPDRWRTYPTTLGVNTRFIIGQNDHLWAATSGGLFLWDGERWELKEEAPHYGLWADNKSVWTGNETGLQTLGFDTRPIGLQNATSRVIAGDADDLWIGTDSGLFRVQSGEIVDEFHSDSTNGLPGDFYNALHVSEDSVWVGTQSGLAVGDGETWSLIERGDPRQNTVNVIVQDSKRGTIWAGTAGGLWRLPANKAPLDPASWIRYSVEDGLLSDTVNAILVDDGGALWLGTNGGLSALEDNGTDDVKEDDVWLTFTTAEGMGNDNRVTALWRDDQGRLWIGTRSGILSHTPISQEPLLKIGGIGTQGQLLLAVQGLTLDWNQHEPFVVFDGRSLATERLAYRSHFPSMEEPWRIGSENRRQFTNLEPGETYTFNVQAFDMDLNASEQIVGEFSLEATPIYARTEAQIAALAVVVGAVLYTPAARAWRAYNRPAYRETWEIEVVGNHDVASPEPYRYEVTARLTYARDLRLLVEGRFGSFLIPAQTITRSASKLIPHEQMRTYLEKLAQSDRGVKILTDDFRTELADMLLPEPLSEHIEQATAQEDYLLRLRLNLAGAPELATFPWEAAQVSDMKPLGLNPATSVSRCLPLDEASFSTDETPLELPLDRKKDPQGLNAPTSISRRLHPDGESRSTNDLPLALPLDRKKALNVLLVVSSPERVGVDDINKEKEYTNLIGALNGNNASVRLLNQYVDQDTGEPTKSQPEALSLELQAPTDVIHYMGHSGPNPKPPHKGEFVLFTEDRNGDFYPTFPADLVDMIAQSHMRKTGPRLLVLNSCQSGRVEPRGRETLAGLVPDLLTGTGLLAVVAMQYPVRIKALSDFTSNFYTAMLETKQLDYAVSVARKAMYHESGLLDWAAPVLYMRVADGMIFEP